MAEKRPQNAEDESTDEEDSEDEEMAELLVKSLERHAGASANKPAAAQQQSLGELHWYPNTGLASEPGSTQVIPEKLQQKINDPEKNLVDGFLVPSRSVRKLNKLAKKNAPDTAGPKWFGMPAQTLTPELKRELQLVKLRGVLDPKHHYKKDDTEKLPKYFQIGTVVEAPGEFYSSRLARKQRKQSIAEELLADNKLQDYRKRKYSELMERNEAGGKKHLKNKDSRKKPSWARKVPT